MSEERGRRRNQSHRDDPMFEVEPNSEEKEMNKKILNLIKKGESRNLEFKESLSLKDEIGKCISAYANSCDGRILVGVEDSGKIKGIQVGKKTIEGLANYIKQNTDSPVFSDISLEKVENKSQGDHPKGRNVIVIKIKEADEKPVFFRGRAYVRVGKSSHRLSASEIRKMAKHSGKKIYWDGEVCEGAGLGDIDEKKVKSFIKKYEELNKKKVVSDGKNFLKNLKCVKNNKPTNAGILLFGKNPQKFFPRAYISIARYSGKDIGSSYLEIKDFEGNLFEIIDKTEEYIRKHTEIYHILKEGQVARERVLQYPSFVIRELVVNTVCHRDYSIAGSKILIKMFKDKIEFDSPGGFSGNVNEKNILDEQFSRNPSIVKILNKVEYIEEMGEGWNRIVEIIKNYPLKFSKMPHVKGNTRVVVSLFSPDEKVKRELSDTGMVNAKLTQVNAKLTQKLSDKDKKIILFVIKNKKINSLECQRLLSMSRVMVNRYFDRLIQEKVIVKKGKGRATYYVFR